MRAAATDVVRTPKEWARTAGFTDDELVVELKNRGVKIHPVSLNRYLNSKRPWPFALIVALKDLSRNVLVDASFVPARARRVAARKSTRKTA